MPNPYPDAFIRNFERQWAGGNPAQSHIAAPAITQDGVIWCGAGNTLVGGANIQMLMRIDPNTIIKTEQNVGRYTGFISHRTRNNKLLFQQHITTQRMIRYSEAGVFEAETTDFAGSGLQWGTGSANNIGEHPTVPRVYFPLRRTADGRHCFTVHVYDATMAWPFTAHASAVIRDRATAYEVTDNKVWNCILANRIDRFDASSRANDANISLAPDAGWPDVLIAFGFLWTASGQSGTALKKINHLTSTVLFTWATRYFSLATNGRHLFAERSGFVDVIDPATNIVLASLGPVITETGVQNHYLKYDPLYNRLVLVISNNPGVNNLTIIDLEPFVRRPRRSGSELWALIPELKDYLW